MIAFQQRTINVVITNMSKDKKCAFAHLISIFLFKNRAQNKVVDGYVSLVSVLSSDQLNKTENYAKGLVNGYDVYAKLAK